MNTDFPRLPFTRSDRTQAPERRVPADDAVSPRVPALSRQACCCLAKPVVVAVMPVTDQRPDPVDIHLCAHHYRASRKSLASAGAIVFDRNGALVTGTDPFELV
ncbi:hypothetical protein [Actinomadura sp. NTSP31]|uniref:hypothetical protein n=1 Tax=Actinomadura sp. NTSP31 TaxID=1735447 RepID=UPI0035BF5060